jgi:hypothetical protein
MSVMAMLRQLSELRLGAAFRSDSFRFADNAGGADITSSQPTIRRDAKQGEACRALERSLLHSNPLPRDDCRVNECNGLYNTYQ